MAIIDVEFVAEDNLTVFTVEGDLSAEEILKYSKECYASRPTKLVLWNANKGSVRSIHASAFRRIAREMKNYSCKRSGGKTALVSEFDLEFGMSRMYEAFAEFEEIPIQYRAFRNVEDAMKWLRE